MARVYLTRQSGRDGKGRCTSEKVVAERRRVCETANNEGRKRAGEKVGKKDKGGGAGEMEESRTRNGRSHNKECVTEKADDEGQNAQSRLSIVRGTPRE